MPPVPADAEITPPPLPPDRRRRALTIAVVSVSLLVLANVTLALAGASFRRWTVDRALVATAPADDIDLVRLAKRFESLRPKGRYVVIDTYANRLRVMEGGDVLRDTVCSTGSGVVLRDPRDGRTWVFDSPVGEHRVQRKVRNPIWAKPDWAFIEEGMLPPRDPSERFDDFSLGDYALYLGDGYIIHGTIFQTLLGRPVTHGCVRLGDEDLEYVYRSVPVGSRVYMY